jgi:hypothetical protein
MLILTSWCLNSDIVEATVRPGTCSPAQTTCTGSGRAIVGIAQTVGGHSAPLRERCGCHQGNVLPLEQCVFTSSVRGYLAPPKSAVKHLRSCPARPDPRPPRS